MPSTPKPLRTVPWAWKASTLSTKPDPSAPEIAVAAQDRRRSPVTVLLAAAEPGRAATVLLAAAALTLGVAGYVHGHLYHEGYRQVSVVGPLFFLNVIGTAATILLLLARRVLAFIGGALSISAGAIVSILISHSSSFFHFSEASYQPTAKIILVAEIVTVLLTLAGAALARRSLLGGEAS